ncbi:MAG TPA: hypothetical protein VGP82_22745 [Ktedonobacterales bacterium]|nr:hypothetical protein [Ktedonobacterales bacterium]
MQHKKRILALSLSGIAILSLVVGVFVFHSGGAQAASSGIARTITKAGTTSFSGAASASEAPVTNPEIAHVEGGDDAANSGNSGGSSPSLGIDRSFSRHHGTTGNGSAGGNLAKAKSNPELVTSFDGLNHRQQRLANGGNQFSVEPPDQGLCASSGFVMESVNDAARVYDTSGNGVNAVTDLNSFYGYAAAFHRPSGPFGPFVTDPSCFYDTDTQRWFNVVLTIDVDPATGDFLGPNHLDIAVSQTSNPAGSWNIYRLPVQDDGTAGTPNHHCSLGPCFGDYPHIGADANGFYITTNEYSFFGPEFHGAQVYAISKAALAAGASSITVVQFDTQAAHPGFTIWPATSPNGSQYDSANSGSEYFLSSTATDEVQVPDFSSEGTGQSNNILLWTLSNTASLNSSGPSLTLASQSIGVNTYGIPPASNQKVGSTPLKDCLNDRTCATFLNGERDKFGPEVEAALDSNDTRMQQVTYANGSVWGALDTAVTINGTDVAGVAYYIVNPHTASLVAQGTYGMANNNLNYPAIGVTASGRAVMAFTLVGADYYPSAAYAGLDALTGLGAVHVAQAGAGPEDGFSDYLYYGNPPGTKRPRWGDYGAAAVVGNNIWIASEYIGQTCTLTQYEAGFGSSFGSCGGTRTALANWDTRITQVTP